MGPGPLCGGQAGDSSGTRTLGKNAQSRGQGCTPSPALSGQPRPQAGLRSDAGVMNCPVAWTHLQGPRPPSRPHPCSCTGWEDAELSGHLLALEPTELPGTSSGKMHMWLPGLTFSSGAWGGLWSAGEWAEECARACPARQPGTKRPFGAQRPCPMRCPVLAGRMAWGCSITFCKESGKYGAIPMGPSVGECHGPHPGEADFPEGPNTPR